MNIQDTIFSNITNEAINDTDTTPVIEHLTINKCGTAIKWTASTLGSYTLKNCIFNNCDIDVNIADVNKATLSYSLSNDNLINCDVDSNSLRDRLPFFLDEINNDYKLQNKLSGYYLDSPAVLLADDSRDAGAWDITYTITATNWENETIKEDFGELQRERTPIMAIEKNTITGALKTYSRQFVQQFTIKLKEAANTTYLYTLERLLMASGLKKLYPVGSGKTNIVSCTIDQVTNGQDRTYFQCEVPLASRDILNDESLSGLFLVTDTNPPSYTGNLPKYVFKVIDYSEDTGLMELEQIYEDYTYSSSWSTTIDIWKSLFVGGVQYKGTDTIGTKSVLKFDYSVGNTAYQELQRDQVKGWMFRVNLGATYYYFRCYSNDDQFIYCEDIFDNVSNVTLNNYYNCLIDFIFVKQHLENVTGSQVNPNTGWKSGGDWFNTKSNRDVTNVSSLPQNQATDATITFQEAIEYDEDGI